MDDYEIFRILDMDGFRIAGPGFRMNGTNNKISPYPKGYYLVTGLTFLPQFV